MPHTRERDANSGLSSLVGGNESAEACCGFWFLGLMGKYMRRKCRGPAGEGDKARAGATAVGGGVRTRSRSATAVSKRRQQATTAARVMAVEEALGRDANGGTAGCYLHLRSRRLFMAAAAVVAPRGPGLEEDASPLPVVADSREVIVAGVSRCSSTASSVDYVAAVRERSGGEAEACESRDVGRSSVRYSGSAGRERRETTPPSSDAESSRQVAGEQKHQRPSSPSSATSFHAAAARARSTTTTTLPPADEIEEFFAAAEKAAAVRFAARYNFDAAHGAPLNGGRFEWTPAAGG